MGQTPKKQSTLMTNLRDNSKKEISPEDLRDAVVSASGPILIWAGKIQPESYDDRDASYFRDVETTYLNPYYFNTGEGASGGGGESTVWEVSSSSVPGVANGQYSVTSGGQGNFRAKVTVADETVTRFEILDPGYGQTNGKTYTVYFANDNSKNFKMKYNGAVFNDSNVDKYFYFRGKGLDGSYHTWGNTIVQATPIGERAEICCHVHGYTEENVFGLFASSEIKNGQIYVSLYKIIES